MCLLIQLCIVWYRRMWFIENITKLYFAEKHILPLADFVLSDGEVQKHVKGWLPCHHTNVGYTLQLGSKRIFQIIDMSVDKTRKQKTKVITKTAKQIGKQKGFAPPDMTGDLYKQLAMKAYTSTALWTCSVLYSHWDLRHMSLDKTFQALVHDIEALVQPDSIAHRTKFLFQPLAHTKALIQRALRQMGELPYKDWDGFDARLTWHLLMQSDTGSRVQPSSHIRKLERYQDLWTTSYLIKEAKSLKAAYRPENVTLIQGSPLPEDIPQDAHIVFKDLEDVYRWKCSVDHGSLHLLNKDKWKPERLIELGVSDIQPMSENLIVHIPWAHTWGQKDWLELTKWSFRHVTCIGRLDQWPSGRGQLFRDMIDSNIFDSSQGLHKAVDAVSMVTVDDIQAFVNEKRKQHNVIQCFYDKHMPSYDLLDCGRRWLKNPKRIRTLHQDTQSCRLIEESKIHSPDHENGNASVQCIRTYKGLNVRAGIYLCSEHTTPFQIHVARTLCNDILYIVNCNVCLFAMQKIAPRKCTINPFI